MHFLLLKLKTNSKLFFCFFFSTREIKPNQTDIGRKVKVKPSINRLSNIPNNNTLNKRDSISSSTTSFVNSSSNSLNSNINNNHNSLTASPLKNNFNLHQQHQHQLQHQQINQHGSINSNSNANNQTTTLGSSGSVVPSRVANSRNNPSSGRGNPDIMKRPIK